MTLTDVTPKIAALHHLNQALKTGIRGDSRKAIENAIDTINNVKTGLNDLSCKRLIYGQNPLLDSSTKGLRLNAKKRGKVWTFRYDFEGKQPVLNIGRYPEIGLNQARELVKEARDLITSGINPKQVTKTNALTVEQVCRKYLELAQVHKKSWEGDLLKIESDIIPVIGHLTAESLTIEDAGLVIDKIIKRGSIGQAENVLKCARSIFNIAMGVGKNRKWLASEGSVIEPWISLAVNPFRHIVTPDRETKACVLQGQQLADYINLMKTVDLDEDIKTLLTLMLYTNTRISEVAHLVWSEIDMSTHTWTLPAERAKNALEHRILLSSQVMEILNDLGPKTGYVIPFDGRKRDNITKAINPDIRGAREYLKVPADFTSHTLRHTGQTLLAKLGYSKEVRDRVSNHVGGKSGDMAAHYNAYEFDDEAKKAWQHLADEIDSMKE